MIGKRAMRAWRLLPVLLLLAGCTESNLKPEAHPDLRQVAAIRDEADKAYTAQEWDAAEAAYRKLTSTVPTEAENWFRLGNIFVHKDRPYDAIAMYKEALIRDPKHSRAWHNLGLTQLRIATNTFVEMQQYLDPADPLNQRAKHIIDGVTELLEEAAPAPAPASQ